MTIKAQHDRFKRKQVCRDLGSLHLGCGNSGTVALRRGVSLVCWCEWDRGKRGGKQVQIRQELMHRGKEVGAMAGHRGIASKDF